ncbi:MAG TPA: hypothetical protein IAB50_07340 [Candidatus Faecivicinus avistercoris]|nr:hypothetical protein [Candidatus Faecivicinus avistercoris]
MGFPDAKISTRSRRTCRRERFSCERAAALSRSSGAGLTGCFSFEKGDFPSEEHRDSAVFSFGIFRQTARRFLFQEDGVFCGVRAENVVKWAQAKDEE